MDRPIVSRVLRRIHLKMSYRYRPYEDPLLAKCVEKEVLHFLQDKEPALILTNEYLVAWRLSKWYPVVLYTDTVFPKTYSQVAHPWQSGMSRLGALFSQRVTLYGLRGAFRVVYPAAWCLEEARKYVDDVHKKAMIVPFGANLEATDELPFKRTHHNFSKTVPLSFLFVGKDWELKGGRTAVAAVRELIRLGWRAQLEIVGPNGRPKTSDGFVRWHGYLDKSIAADRAKLDELFKSSAFLLLPTKAEGYNGALLEAAAYGLPVVASDVRGIRESVAEYRFGETVTEKEDPGAYVSAILQFLEDPDLYETASAKGNSFFETRGNWKTAVKALVDGICHT
jgi:glycosyltransferase involved in cell wall biosynthesis